MQFLTGLIVGLVLAAGVAWAQSSAWDRSYELQQQIRDGYGGIPMGPERDAIRQGRQSMELETYGSLHKSPC